jgi:hypothetical protein
MYPGLRVTHTKMKLLNTRIRSCTNKINWVVMIMNILNSIVSGVLFDAVRDELGKSELDDFDLICHLVYDKHH